MTTELAVGLGLTVEPEIGQSRAIRGISEVEAIKLLNTITQQKERSGKLIIIHVLKHAFVAKQQIKHTHQSDTHLIALAKILEMMSLHDVLEKNFPLSQVGQNISG